MVFSLLFTFTWCACSYVGPEVFCQQPEGPLDQCPHGQGAWGSDTYHLWTLVGTGNVYRYTEPEQAKAWMSTGIWVRITTFLPLWR